MQCIDHTKNYSGELSERSIVEFGVGDLRYSVYRCKRCSDIRNRIINRDNNPGTNAEPYRLALDWVHDRFPGRVGPEGRTAWEKEHGRSWKSLRATPEQRDIEEYDWDFDFSDRKAQDPSQKKKPGPRKPSPESPNNFHDEFEQHLQTILAESGVEFERRRLDLSLRKGMMEIKPRLNAAEMWNALSKCIVFRDEMGYAPAILSVEMIGPTAKKILNRYQIPFIVVPDKSAKMMVRNDVIPATEVLEIIEKYNTNLKRVSEATLPIAT